MTPGPSIEGAPRDDSHVASPRAVVCGTFRRAREELGRDCRALEAAGCRIVSPVSVDFVAEVEGFVLAAHEVGRAPREVELDHLRALESADFVWLHAPDGYVGTSAALELGVAHALGIPSYASHTPSDHVLEAFVRIASPAEAVNHARAAGPHTPSRPLHTLQDYYGRIARQRGYDTESAQDTMLLLTEEIGELARAVRKHVGLSRSSAYPPDNVAAAELADVQLYLLHMANILDVELGTAVSDKEQQNAIRAADSALAA
jgi:NTP pyrophosphatase (non-canonical NTP hydrolase)